MAVETVNLSALLFGIEHLVEPRLINLARTSSRGLKQYGPDFLII